MEVLAKKFTSWKKRNFSVLNFSLNIGEPEISFMLCEIEEIGYLGMEIGGPPSNMGSKSVKSFHK